MTFIEFAAAHPEKEFLVTRIGCGIAGLKERDVALLFKCAVRDGNIVLPKSFVKIIIE